MKIRRFAMALIFSLINVGFMYAGSPAIIDTKASFVKSNAEVTEKTNAQNLQKESTEQGELLPKLEGASRYDAENLNLSFSCEEQPDTTNFYIIEYYVKSIAPLSKKAGYDSKSLEMIEVL